MFPRFAVTALLAVSFAFVPAPSTTSVNATVGVVAPSIPMLQPRSGHSATLLPNGMVLIAGGMRRNQDFYRSAELYDPATNAFRPTGEMHQERVGQAAILLQSGKVLIAGGWISRGTTDSAEIYDPATGKFRVIAKMNAPRARPTATLLADGDVLLTGGAVLQDKPGGVASAEIFHAATETFEPVGSMHDGRVSHTATLLRDGRVLIVGGRGEVDGHGDKVTAGVDLYDPKTRKFTATGQMLNARYKHTAGLLPDGRVLVAGGTADEERHNWLSSAEIYDPRTGTFSATASLNEGRFKLPDEAVQLASGQLLVSGGSRHVEIYNPATNNFVMASGELDAPWHYMSETRLLDGRVLLAGGYPNSDQATTQTWIYRP